MGRTSWENRALRAVIDLLSVVKVRSGDESGP